MYKEIIIITIPTGIYTCMHTHTHPKTVYKYLFKSFHFKRCSITVHATSPSKKKQTKQEQIDTSVYESIYSNTNQITHMQLIFFSTFSSSTQSKGPLNTSTYNVQSRKSIQMYTCVCSSIWTMQRVTHCHSYTHKQ